MSSYIHGLMQQISKTWTLKPFAYAAYANITKTTNIKCDEAFKQPTANSLKVKVTRKHASFMI